MDADGSFTRFSNDPADSGTLAHDFVNVITEDSEGALWIGGWAGLSRLDPETGTFTTYVDTASGLDAVFDLLEDRAGRFWIGTFNGGLHLFDRDAGTSRAYTQKHGLAHDTVHSILEDDTGGLWLSTGNGLSRFDPDAETFRNYDLADGLQGRSFDGGGVKTRRGELLFGGANGINAFFPRHVKDSPDPPQVVLTTFKVFHRQVMPGDASPLSRHISRTEKVVLPHDQNMITLGFAGLHYGRPDRNSHAYRLEPLESDWNDIGSYRYATYPRLDPGEYTFRVKAANSDGVWNEEGATLELTILPPWWRTGWAYALYAIVAVLAIAAADRFQRRRLLRQEREKAREERAQLRAEAAELQAKAAEAQAQAMEAEYQRTTRELEEARRLQLSMLPEALPDHPEFEIAAFMKTATEVGGDYYDFEVADDGTLTVAIGDATGHGTRAGTMVAATKVLFKLLAGDSDSLDVLKRSTRVIKRMNLENMFMALALARIGGGRLEVAGAGMPPTLVRRASNGKVDELDLEGAPLGSFEDFPYETASAEIAPGDVVVLMSDGLPETLDPEGEILGYDRVSAALSTSAIDSPQSVIDHLARVADEWASGRVADDDLTLVVLRRRAA
jgi:serine phosphatase RsbU (regulator of sigma subunit)